MAIPMTGVITGAAMAGFTSPTFTLTADTSPSAFGKQSYVSAIGGTVPNVVAHSISSPFTVLVRRQAILRSIKDAVWNGLTGRYSKIPFNAWDMVFRKGSNAAANTPVVNQINFPQKVYAGSETYATDDVKALFSLAAGFIWANANNAVDSVKTGSL